MVETTIGGLVADGAISMGDGYRTKRSEHGQPGYRIIRVADVRDESVFLDGDDFVSSEYAAPMGSKIAQAGDVLLTTKGTVGRVAVMPASAEPAVYSPQLCYFRIHDHDVLDPRFLRYWFRSAEFTGQSSYLQGNTDMAPYISLADLRATRITVPAIDRQRAIAEVLGALDDKIAVNARLAATADDLARARVEGAVAGYGTSVQLGDVTEFHNKRRVPLSSRERESRNGEIPYYGANGIVDHVDEPIFDGQHVLVGEDGTVVTSSGTPVVNLIWGPAWVNNHAHVLSGRGVSTALLRVLISRTVVDSFVTGAVQPKLSMGNLRKVALEVPASAALGRVEEDVQALTHTLMVRQDENRVLESLRDALLPQLTSGKLRVREAAEMAGL
ncbi:restriction endonuclease subunit S [Isoptericola sp. 4D.3]|uniref:Restriction endonuclease subunit S n=1 Tax=Isoptericola peretonis TaxID=2918523 RepID=A0ABT0IYP1_9MICO|nr:restriction endonuclease subunit S [Isoptericola sp. 4D.3]